MNRRYRFAPNDTPMCLIQCRIFLAFSIVLNLALFAWAVTP